MISVAIFAVATGAAVVSGTTWACMRPRQNLRLAPISQYSIVQSTGTKKKMEVFDQHERSVCKFELVTRHDVLQHIYRMYGRLGVSNSSNEVATFYRNTVGKGGYIEYFYEELDAGFSLLPKFFRFQQDNNTLRSEPLRIYILAKLLGNMYEVHIDQDEAKLVWCSKTRILYKLDGLPRQQVAAMSSTHVVEEATEQMKSAKKNANSRHVIATQNDLINPYLAVSVLLYFILLESEH